MRYLIAAVALLTGCSTVSQIPVTGNHVYRRDLKVTINNKPCIGVCVAPKATNYQIKVEADRIDYISLESCHRHFTAEDQGDSWSYTYTPLDIENGCTLEIISLDKKNSKNGFALIDFEDDQFRLPAKVECDGSSNLVLSGTTICQSKAGLMQSVEFTEPMKVFPTEDCPLGGQNDGMKYTFPLVKGICVYAFGSKSGFFKLVTIGSEDIILEKL